jgi:hypothetical protein
MAVRGKIFVKNMILREEGTDQNRGSFLFHLLQVIRETIGPPIGNNKAGFSP